MLLNSLSNALYNQTKMIKKVENNNSCWNLSSVWYLDWLEFLGIWAEDRSMTLHFTWKLLPSASKLGIWNCGCLLNRIMKIIILYLFCNNFEFIYRDNFWINSKSYQRKFTLSTATVKCQCKFSLSKVTIELLYWQGTYTELLVRTYHKPIAPLIT